MRLFLAIEPTPPVRTILADVLTRAEQALGPAAAALRWVTRENLHVPLQFLGDVERDRLERLVSALEPVVPLQPFAVSLDRFGAFPPSGPPRTLWLGVGHGLEQVRRIYAELERRLATLGFEPESRPYSPHMTVARIRDPRRVRGPSVRSVLASFPLPQLEWQVTHALLFESDLTGPRPTYTERGRLELGD